MVTLTGCEKFDVGSLFPAPVWHALYVILPLYRLNFLGVYCSVYIFFLSVSVCPFLHYIV